MDFESLVDMTSECQAEIVVPVPVRSVAATRFNRLSYYRVDGAGLWRAEIDADGVTLRTVFTGEEIRLTRAQWATFVAGGRIRQVAS